MTATKRLKLPANGPSDPAAYLTLLAVHNCPEGALDDEGETLWACDPVRRERFPLDLMVIDDLIARGWLDDATDCEAIRVTAAGRYWLNKFLKANGGAL